MERLQAGGSNGGGNFAEKETTFRLAAAKLAIVGLLQGEQPGHVGTLRRKPGPPFRCGVGLQMAVTDSRETQAVAEGRTSCEGRLHYRCGTCVKQDAGEPGSASSPLRVLYLYALAGVGEQALTPLHSKPVRLLVAAPPAKWALGQKLRDE